MLVDLIGGQIGYSFDTMTAATPHVKSGKVRAIAQTRAKRASSYPNVPTIAETGAAVLELESWFGYFAPSKTPPEIVARLRTELARVIAAPDVVDTFRKAGGKPMSLNPDQTRVLVQRDVERWTKLIRDADIKAE